MFTEKQLTELFLWLDSVPFKSTKTKKGNVHRDFADGVLLAELIHHFAPKLVSLHSYSPMNGRRGKVANWETLNCKVLCKLGIPSLSVCDLNNLANAKPGAIEELLTTVREKIDQYRTGLNPPLPDTVQRYYPQKGYQRKRSPLKVSTSASCLEGATLPTLTKGSTKLPGRHSSDCSMPRRAVTFNPHAHVSTSKGLEPSIQRYDSSKDSKVDPNRYEDVCWVQSAFERDAASGDMKKVVQHVVYEGMKMVPQNLYNETSAMLSEANDELDNLRIKLRRLETLISLKDNRLDYLTMEVHKLTMKLGHLRGN